MRKVLDNLTGLDWRFATFAFVTFLVFGVNPAVGQTKTAIRISPESVIESDLIELGNISQITSGVGRLDRLRSISLGYAPNIGMTRELNRRQILLAINAAGFTENDITLVSPERVVVRRQGQNVSTEQIREVVERTLLDQLKADGIATRIVSFELGQGIQVPVGTVDIKVTSTGVRNIFARFPVAVEIRVDNQTVRRLAATVEIEAFADIYVAAKDLSVNTKLAPSDVRIERRRIQRPITHYLRDPNKLRGAMTIGAVPSGSELTADAIVAGVVVRLGDTVRIEAASNKIKIVINGEARANGRIGDRIAVKNTKSGAILQGVVIDEGIVRVLF